MLPPAKYYSLSYGCLSAPMALTDNTKFVSPSNTLYSASKYCYEPPSVEKAFEDSQRGSNRYEQNNLRRYADSCTFCSKPLPYLSP